MRAEELMIDNHVINTEFGKNKVDTIENLEPMRVWLTHGKTYIPIEFIEPIPLTPEILEKNGFVKSNTVSDTPPYDKDEEGNMYYSLGGKHKFWGWWQPSKTYYVPANALGDIEIRYVHELQQALRLCKIDKQIIL